MLLQVIQAVFDEAPQNFGRIGTDPARPHKLLGRYLPDVEAELLETNWG